MGGVGPYRQSERTALYQKYAAQLVEAGHAYPCFATAEELAEMRKVARKRSLGQAMTAAIESWMPRRFRNVWMRENQ